MTTKIEDHLKDTFSRVAGEVPEVHGLGATAAERARRRSRWTAVLVAGTAAGITAIVVLTVTLLSPSMSPDETAAPAPSPNAANNWLGLTGKDLGDALGLQPIPTSQMECKYFAEFKNNVGYCLDAVEGADADLRALAWRISHVGPSPTQSTGQRVTVPNVIGLWSSEAEDVIRYAGLVPSRTFDNDARVIAQEPAAGSEAAVGTTVTLTVRPRVMVGSIVLRPLTQDTLARMSRRGMDATVLDEQAANPSISSIHAMRILRQEGSSDFTQMSLTEITVKDYTDHNGNPIINNQLAWVAYVPNAPNPSLGGPYPGSSDTSSGRADWVVLIDATNGHFLQSRTL